MPAEIADGALRQREREPGSAGGEGGEDGEAELAQFLGARRVAVERLASAVHRDPFSLASAQLDAIHLGEEPVAAAVRGHLE